MALSPFNPACLIFALLLSVGLTSCNRTVGTPTAVVTDGVVVSVRDQELAVMRQGEVVKTYKISTSKFGLGDARGSNRTPLGHHSVAQKIGGEMPKGMVFKSRRPTGEIVAPNSPGRDPIVSRIIWLRGHESRNRNAHGRLIYIHGTTEERLIGSPASYGCIRMKSDDIVDMYPLLAQGDPVVIERCSLKASTDAAYAMTHPSAGKGMPQLAGIPHARAYRQAPSKAVAPALPYTYGSGLARLNPSEVGHVLNRQAPKSSPTLKRKRRT